MAGFKANFRPAESADDYRACADVWLEASLVAHDFVGSDFWLGRHEAMASNYLPSSSVMMVLAGDGRPEAFSAVKADRLEALFVRPAAWGRGLGTALLELLFESHEELSLSVYAENLRSVGFYLRRGFRLSSEAVCPDSGLKELLMFWGKAPADGFR